MFSSLQYVDGKMKKRVEKKKKRKLSDEPVKAHGKIRFNLHEDIVIEGISKKSTYDKKRIPKMTILKIPLFKGEK